MMCVKCDEKAQHDTITKQDVKATVLSWAYTVWFEKSNTHCKSQSSAM